MADALGIARRVVACLAVTAWCAPAAAPLSGPNLAFIDMQGIVLSEMSLGLSDALRFDASVAPDAPVSISIIYDITALPEGASPTQARYPAVVSFEILFGAYRLAGTEGTLTIYDDAPLGSTGELIDFITFDLVPDVLEGFLLNESNELVPLDEAQGFSIRTPTLVATSSDVLDGSALVVPQPSDPWSVIGGGADLVQTTAPFALSHSISFGISRWFVPEPGVAWLLVSLIAMPGRRALR